MNGDVSQVKNNLVEFKDLPKFDDRRINYSKSERALVLSAFVMCEGKLLLLKRSDRVSSYSGKWNCVGGYIDEEIDVRDKVRKELREELGIKEEEIAEIIVGKLNEIKDTEISKVWKDYPVLVRLKNFVEIDLDWEHTEYKWIYPDDLELYDCVFGLEESYERVSGAL